MTEAMGELARLANHVTVELGRAMEVFRDVVPPGWREADDRQGYVGSRCGWYPAKPKRHRRAKP